MKEDDKFTSKHVELEMPAGCPRRVVHWAVEYTVLKCCREIWAGDTGLQDSFEEPQHSEDGQEVQEPAEKTGKKHAETQEESQETQRKFLKKSELSLISDVTERSSNLRAEK